MAPSVAGRVGACYLLAGHTVDLNKIWKKGIVDIQLSSAEKLH